MKKIFYLMVVLVPVSGWAQQAEEIAIRKESATFSANYINGNFEAMSRQYMTDAVLMPPARDVLTGTKAILEFWNGTTRPIMHRSEPVAIVVEGNSAHDYGYFYTQSQKPGEEPGPVFSAKYYILWTKDPQGQWKMKVDMWNSRRTDWNR